jgi:hypothetical protein
VACTTTYIELGDGNFVNADQVTLIGYNRYEPGDATVKVHVSGYNYSFHADRIRGAAAAHPVSLALLAELGRAPAREGRTRIVTYVDGAVRTRFL